MHLIYHISNLSYACIQLLYCSFIYVDLNNTTYDYTYLYLCWLYLSIHRYGTPGCIYKMDLLCYFYYYISSCVPCFDMKCIYHCVIYLGQSNNLYPIIMNHTLILYYKHLCKNYDYINNHIKSLFLSIYVVSLKCNILTIEVQYYYQLNLMFAIINSSIIIFSKRKFTLIYPFPLLSNYIFVSLVSYRYTLKVNALNIMRLYTFIIKATRELKSFNHSFNVQSLFSYKSIVLLTSMVP